MVARGIMFHHFHRDGGGGTPAQGSLTSELFTRLIDYIGKKNNILDATEWASRARCGRLNKNDVCLTFDDNLRCQFEIAKPVLDVFSVRAFFFIYSSVNEGRQERLEIYRVFRTQYFETIESFYAAFEETIPRVCPSVNLDAIRSFNPAQYLKDFSFYTDGDRRFRFIRDHILGRELYEQVMDQMILSRGLSHQKLGEGLWMENRHLMQLAAEGHVIGLHSYSHPTQLALLSSTAQSAEYLQNYNHVVSITGQSPFSMSHPCNSYDSQTLRILSDLGISIGFRSNMSDVQNRSCLEYPREDHATIASLIRSA